MAIFRLYDDGEYYIIRNTVTSVIYRGHFSSVKFVFNSSQTTVAIFNLQNGVIFNTPILISDFENEFGQAFDYNLLVNYILYNKTKDPSSGGGLSVVTTDATLTGDGTTTNPLSVVPIPDVNIYNSDGTLTANRAVDVNDKLLKFITNQGGVFVENINSATPSIPFQVSNPNNEYGVLVNSGLGIRSIGNTYGFVAQAYIGGYFYANQSQGEGIRADQGAGDFAIRSMGRMVVDDGGVVNSPSVLLELSSTTKGFLMPRMTTAQILAIVSPVNGMQVYNTNRNRVEWWNGSYWRGESSEYSVMALASNPVNGQTIYFGNLPKAPTTTANISKIYIKKSGVIRKVDIISYATTAGGAQTWQCLIRVNNTTDYLIQSVATATNERRFFNNNLNIPVIEGDFFEMKMINPTWTGSPNGVVFGGNTIIE